MTELTGDVDSTSGDPPAAERRALKHIRKTLSAHKFKCLAACIYALEDALSIVTGDNHPLLVRGLRTEAWWTGQGGTSAMKLEDHADAGILLRRGDKAERLLGAQAAEVSLCLPF